MRLYRQNRPFFCGIVFDAFIMSANQKNNGRRFRFWFSGNLRLHQQIVPVDVFIVPMLQKSRICQIIPEMRKNCRIIYASLQMRRNCRIVMFLISMCRNCRILQRWEGMSQKSSIVYALPQMRRKCIIVIFLISMCKNCRIMAEKTKMLKNCRIVSEMAEMRRNCRIMCDTENEFATLQNSGLLRCYDFSFYRRISASRFFF